MKGICVVKVLLELSPKVVFWSCGRARLWWP